MAIAVIDQSKCDRCAVCAAELSCPIDVVRRVQSDNRMRPGSITIDTRKCLGCGKCVWFCHSKAIQLTDLTSA